MKKTLLLLCALFTAWTQASADVTATVDEVTIAPGGTAKVSVKITGDATAETAAQLFLTLPEGITPVDGGIALNSATCSDHAVVSNFISDTRELRIVVYSMTLAPFKANGELLTIELQAASDFSGQQSTPIETFAFATPESTETNITGQNLVINGQNVLMGDVNGDNNINVADAIMILQYYVGKNPTGFNADAADVDNNGSIGVSDAIKVLQIFVGKE